MSEQVVASKPVNEYVVEVRFKLKSRPTYDLNELAKSAAEHMDLAEWKIRGRRFDITDPERQWLGFASDMHAGFVGRACPSAEYFTLKALKFLRFFFKHDPFGDLINVERIGVKTSFADAYDGKLSELNNRFKQRLFAKEEGRSMLQRQITTEEEPAITTAEPRIKFNGGAVRKRKLSQLFKTIKRFPDTALYVEMDHFILPKAEVKTRQVYGTIQVYCQQNYSWYQRIKQVVFE